MRAIGVTMPVKFEIIQKNSTKGRFGYLCLPRSIQGRRRRLAKRRATNHAGQPPHTHLMKGRFEYLPTPYTTAADQAYVAVRASLQVSLGRPPTPQETAVALAHVFGLAMGTYRHSTPHKHQIDALYRLHDRACEITRRALKEPESASKQSNWCG